jgi:hypothetical protein
VEVRPLLDLEGILMKQKEKRNRSKANLTGGKRKDLCDKLQKGCCLSLKSIYSKGSARKEGNTHAGAPIERQEEAQGA